MSVHTWEYPEMYLIWILNQANQKDWPNKTQKKLPIKIILQARILKRVAIPFSRRSSQSRDRTQVFLIAGRFFTVWAIREAQKQPNYLPMWLDHFTFLLATEENSYGFTFLPALSISQVCCFLFCFLSVCFLNFCYSYKYVVLWYLDVLICNSLMTYNFKHLFICV